MESKLKRPKFKLELNPAQALALGFGFLILIGTILLNLPVASVDGKSIGTINALFTSTSAVCVTGLVVVDTGTHWTLFGKFVIILLIQIGGLGVMTITTMMAIISGRKITLKNRMIVQEALNQFSISGVIKLVKYVILITLGLETAGFVLLTIGFMKYYPLKTSLMYGFFHSVSAYCNAGFDLIGNYRSLTPFASDWIINLTVLSLIFIGGLGFTVILDIFNVRRFKKLTAHSKLAITVSIALIVFGFFAVLIAEFNNPDTLKGMDMSGKFLASLFQAMTPRTAGFNTLDLNLLHNSTVFVIIILMFIGASPTSTGGGIKTTTFAVLVAAVISEIKGKEDTSFFKRRISNDTVKKAMSVFGVSITLVIFVTLFLTFTEEGQDFYNILFEAVSAFGTVGLSRGITSSLSDAGKLIISMTMFAGRVGPVTLLVAIATYKKKGRHGNYRYPEGKISVG